MKYSVQCFASAIIEPKSTQVLFGLFHYYIIQRENVSRSFESAFLN